MSGMERESQPTKVFYIDLITKPGKVSLLKQLEEQFREQHTKLNPGEYEVTITRIKTPQAKLKEYS